MQTNNITSVIGDCVKRGNKYNCNASAKDSPQKYRKSIEKEQERQ